MIDSDFARRQMIEQQVRAWDVLDLAVLEAMERVPREEFVPPAVSRPRLRRHERAARPRAAHAFAEARRPDPAGARDPARRRGARDRHRQRLLRRLPRRARPLGALGRDPRRSRGRGPRQPAAHARASNVTVENGRRVRARRRRGLRRHRADGLAAASTIPASSGCWPRAGGCSSSSASAPSWRRGGSRAPAPTTGCGKSLFETAIEPAGPCRGAAAVRFLTQPVADAGLASTAQVI